jgi:YesN/AraC family two-component response regulator
VMDGAKMIRALFKLRPESKFIVTSGRPDNFPQDLAKELGVKHFLPKPCKTEHLLRALGQVVAEAGT